MIDENSMPQSVEKCKRYPCIAALSSTSGKQRKNNAAQSLSPENFSSLTFEKEAAFGRLFFKKIWVHSSN